MRKPSVPKGTRDFLPGTMRKRNYIFGVIRDVFERYGYQPIETPATEHLDTLTGKYGEEGDRLIFKILSRGDKLRKAIAAGSDSALSEEALRYDLTVPFARFTVQHQNDLTFPFRRYQIQPVWRADRPQKGRYREFYQCDADVVGTGSLRCEAEFVRIFDEVFTALGIPVDIRINNRKLLSAVASSVGAPERMTELVTAMDKLDKLPLERVKDELRQKEFSEEALTALERILASAARGDAASGVPDALAELLGEFPEGKKGLEELQYIFSKTDKPGLATARLRFDLSLARGLNYYTGAIFEVVPRTDAQVGSICGGGRYDDLTGIFGMPDMSGVGISFGADRIYDLLEAVGGFPEKETEGTTVLFVNFGEAEGDYCAERVHALRAEGIKAELYPDAVKMKKQMKYADDLNIPFTVLAGEDEIRRSVLKVKQMKTGVQEEIPEAELGKYIKNI